MTRLQVLLLLCLSMLLPMPAFARLAGPLDTVQSGKAAFFKVVVASTV